MGEVFFKERFGARPEVTLFVPGRVNLIGEHIDYNGGRVLPCALGVGITLSLKLRQDDQVTVVYDKFEGAISASLSDDMNQGWARYAFYAVRLAKRLGWVERGADIALVSTLSHGAGLSSSAALCVAVIKALRDVSSMSADDVEIAQLARRIENEDIGVPCGIMDQMAVAVAKPGQALFLDTESLDYDPIPLPTSHRFVVLHSGIHRELADGRYGARKQECDVAKEHFGTNDLCHLTLDDVVGNGALPEPVRRRVRHCITEHHRTVSAATALRDQRMTDFGMLMDESHLSMRDDFEMSVPGIDRLVEEAKVQGAIGARLTGGGFGGCIVACVAADGAEDWERRVLEASPGAFRVQ